MGKRWTVCDIAAAVNTPNGPSRYFFDRSWMRAGNESFEDYKVKHVNGKVFLCRTAGKGGPAMWEFIPDRNELVYVNDLEAM